MIKYSRIIFPFRSITFLSLYIILNTVLYGRGTFARNRVLRISEPSILSNPRLPDNILTVIDVNYTATPMYNSYYNGITGWVAVSDVFIIFLFVVLVLGFMANYPHLNMFISILHCIGILLATLFTVNYWSLNYLICGCFFGIIVPGLMEIYNIICLFAFKSDFYIPRNINLNVFQ